MWWDFYKLFSYAFTDDPIAQKDNRKPNSPGVSQPDAMPDIRAMADGGIGGSTSVRLRDTNDFVDLSTVTNRMHRYKEYERLRSMAEIEMAMTVFADEACMGGDTLVATPAYEGGYRTLQWLAENTTDRFLVYAFDFDKNDYTLAWGYDARFVKEVDALKILLDDGSEFVATADHQLLTKAGEWRVAGKLRMGDELTAFYRIPANQALTGRHNNQHPRVRTNNKGWITERQLVDEWRFGKDIPQYASCNKYCRMICEGLTYPKIEKLVGYTELTVRATIEKAGWSTKELKWLGNKPDSRRIVGVMPAGKRKVYDLSVDKHENFCTNWGVSHNCQEGDNRRVLEVVCENQEVKEELEFLLFNRKMLNFDQKKIWNRAKNLFIAGDDFWEIVVDPENPKSGVVDLQFLPPDSMFRIETTKGKLVEFQQSKEGPDYQSLSRVEVTQATDADLMQATAIRFAPEQIIHVRIGDERKTFYPYGISLIEAARGPAHQLRLMEDAMVVYRLCLVGESRVRTSRGWKYIKDVKEGDNVYSLDRLSLNPLSSKIVFVKSNDVQPVYRLRSDHIEIIGTKTHPVLVNRQGVIQMVDLGDIIPRDDMLINVTQDEEYPIPMPSFVETKWHDWAYLSEECRWRLDLDPIDEKYLHRDDFYIISEVCKGLRPFPRSDVEQVCDLIGLDKSDIEIRRAGKDVPVDELNLPQFVDEDFARLFGFLLGDGHMRSTGLNSFTQFDFTCGVDEPQNDRYANLIKTYFGHCGYSKEWRRKYGSKYVISSRAACHVLLRLGFRPGTFNKRIPKWAFVAPKSIRRALVEGLADADAMIRNLNSGLWTAEFALGNKQLIEDIKELWHSCGLCSGHIRHRVREGGHEIENGRRMPTSTSYELYISSKTLPKYEKVRSITYAGEEEVFDFEVNRDEHNFVVNGTCTSNTRAPERRVFYIDVQQLTPAKAEAFVERMKDQFKKKKVPKNNAPEGASSVEERWHAPAADEDYWIPIRPNANTRVETLPGAQNLGEIDDTVYFRNKLFIALNFPKNYFNNEDAQVTKVSLSSQDIKFARMIERLQSHMEDAFWALCERHLRLRGFPEESYEDLEIKMTPPSEWRELTRMEVLSGRIQNAGALKGSQLLSDFDILTEWMKYSEDEAKMMIARMKVQKIDDLKLQIFAQNPRLIGVGLPPDDEEQVSSEPSMDNPMMGGDPSAGGPPPPDGGDPTGGMGGAPAPPSGGPAPKPTGGGSTVALPEPSDEDIHKYDLDIRDFASEQDEEEQDASEDS